LFFAEFQAMALSSAKKTEKALGPKIKKLEAALAEAESSLEEVGGKNQQVTLVTMVTAVFVTPELLIVLICCFAGGLIFTY